MGDYMNFLFNPNGRISRKDIWLKFLLVSFIVSFVAGVFDGLLGLGGNGPIGTIVSIFYIWPGIAISIKRFHDRGMTGWWVLIIYAVIIAAFVLMASPFFGIIMENLDSLDTLDETVFTDALIEGGGMIAIFAGIALMLATSIFAFVVNYCLAGQAGPNKYGPDPLSSTGGTVDTFN